MFSPLFHRVPAATGAGAESQLSLPVKGPVPAEGTMLRPECHQHATAWGPTSCNRDISPMPGTGGRGSVSQPSQEPSCRPALDSSPTPCSFRANPRPLAPPVLCAVARAQPGNQPRLDLQFHQLLVRWPGKRTGALRPQSPRLKRGHTNAYLMQL